MCSPMLIAGGLMAGSAVQKATAGISSGNYNAEVAENNASLAEANAASALSSGASQSQAQRSKGNAVLGSERATTGASNVERSGSALSVLSDDAGKVALDSQAILDNASRQAWGFQQQAENYRGEADLARASARSGAIGSILGGAASAGGLYAAGLGGGAGSSLFSFGNAAQPAFSGASTLFGPNSVSAFFR